MRWRKVLVFFPSLFFFTSFTALPVTERRHRYFQTDASAQAAKRATRCVVSGLQTDLRI